MIEDVNVLTSHVRDLMKQHENISDIWINLDPYTSVNIWKNDYGNMNASAYPIDDGIVDASYWIDIPVVDIAA